MQAFIEFIYIYILQKLYDMDVIITTVIGVVISTIFLFITVPEKKWKKILLAILPAAMTFILCGCINFSKTHYTYLPNINLAEESLNLVHSQLKDAGLWYSDRKTEYDEEAQKQKDEGKPLTDEYFKVVKCTPESGEFVKRKTVVKLWVSWIAEPEPDDGGPKPDDGEPKPDDGEPKPDDGEPKPDDGEPIKKADTVIGNFALKGELWKVPDVRGEAQGTAEKVLGTLKISYHIGGEDYSDEIEKGSVLSQKPEAGTAVDENTEVVLVVSKGSKPVQVPDVVGMSKKKAKNKLEKSGLKVTVEEEEGYNDTVKAGDVVTQSTNAGESVPPGTEIRIEISKGQKPTPTETPKPTPTETPELPSPKPTEVPVPTATPEPPTPTEAPVPTATPSKIPEKPLKDSDDTVIPEKEVD